MSDCIEYAKCKDRRGYGVDHRNGKTYRAHRLAWADSYGEIPDGLVIRHACNNRACINLEHLLLGTQADNIKDMIEQGRHAKGSARGNAKLAETDIPDIRRRLANGESYTSIARVYNVNRTTITRIAHGETWVHA
jgi:hypothetical protein